ncbi:MAG TPA: GTP-sensing pleiotropic transcriptional regulator CodY, partial [Desulfobacteria bacterium]|nr:GTP-sensing pleiotropic transcriptional regulator CodY [Desulfobacteria bacterium]
MENLLDKARAINKLLQKAAGHPVDFHEMASVLCENIGANVYIVGRRGKILGHAFVEKFMCDVVKDIIEAVERFPEEYNEQLLEITET